MATPAGTSRRLGAPDAKNRVVLLNAAEELMRDEGYAAVTSRRVAEKAGLKPQLVHYYFRTMDDLFLELFRRRAEQLKVHQKAALNSSQPLWALWELNTDPAGTAMTMEFIALANHRKVLMTEIAKYAEVFRQETIKTLTAAMARYNVPFEEFTPTVLMVLMTGATQVLVQEEFLGMTLGHQETRAFADKWLTYLEGPRQLPDNWRHLVAEDGGAEDGGAADDSGKS
ncbi:TetR/AcrR family transcriptional regulator [Mycolicibacterium confluentis]|uniref:TetR family transcriptional regulator n=1 Tax=Mycolicibacterium confluentis TaxID=28047 RepID=A0A7I7XTN6_9MYCO|nr:TetR/AcrR family transcriptional regulator [Mycolicibacterium confluentis]MCV7322131.1 helix-turn-helix transcriptional regulator [Mycolicibacterium confluentis]BBZ32615.1 TetR family transcriptional regulator [Mycolicibacterium confluentis]